MSLAAETRDTVRDRPYLLDALRAGAVNYAAAARALDVAEDTDAVATALRRFAEDLPALEAGDREARVTMHGGFDLADSAEDATLRVGERGYVRDGGTQTGVFASGEIDAEVLERTLGLLRTHDVSVDAAGFASDALALVVDRRDGATAVRLVERALDGVPTV